jgi:hypothetical protein
VPGDTQLVHDVVGHLLDVHVRPGRRRRLVSHPEQAQRPPALGFEAGSQRLGGSDEIEVDTPVREPGQRLVRERHKGVHAHRRVVLDPHDVEVVIARVARGAHDRAVRPWLENVAYGGLQGVVPVARSRRHAAVHGAGCHTLRLRPEVRVDDEETPYGSSRGGPPRSDSSTVCANAERRAPGGASLCGNPLAQGGGEPGSSVDASCSPGSSSVWTSKPPSARLRR